MIGGKGVLVRPHGTIPAVCIRNAKAGKHPPMIAELIAQPEELAYAADQDAWKLFVFRKQREALPTRGSNN